MADPDPTLDEIINHPDTEDSSLSYLFAQLTSLGFPVVNWQEGGSIFALTRLFAKVMALFAPTARDIARGMILKLSDWPWLDVLLDWYNEVRIPATIAVGTIRLSVASGAGPYSPGASGIWVKDAVRGLRFFNVAGVTLPAGPSATDVVFSAESPGALYSLPMGTALSLITSLPGVTAALVAPTGQTTWLTTQGTDAESAANAKTRVRAKWTTLGALKTNETYLFLCVEMPYASVLPTVRPTKVYVDGSNPRGPYTLDVWFAGPTGPLSASDEAIVQAYLDDRKGPNTDLLSGNAETQTITVAANVYVFGGFDQAIAQATDALIELINDLPIGGLLQLSDVVKAIVNIDGVDKVDLSTLTINGVFADYQLGVKKLGVNGAHALAYVMATV